MNAIRRVAIGLSIAALCFSSTPPAAAAGLHIITVTVLRNGVPTEATVNVVDMGVQPPEHGTGVAKNGVYKFATWPDADGKLCFKAYTKFSPILKSDEVCMKPPYQSTVTLHLR